MPSSITLTVNGRSFPVTCQPDETLLEVLRHHLKLFSVREACGIGICGACTVLVDGEAVSSCLALAALMEGKTIVSAEGLVTADGELDPVQRAFLEKAAFQCSYCTPGMIVATRALLAENPAPTGEEIREYLAGNLCRCGSYLNIVEAVHTAAEYLRTARADAPPARGS